MLDPGSKSGSETWTGSRTGIEMHNGFGSGSAKAKRCGSCSGSGSTTLTCMQEIDAKNQHAIGNFLKQTLDSFLSKYHVKFGGKPF
jgi:hypothetical protein